MARLLDINLLIALGDRDHVHHRAARSWFGKISSDGWATCPTTENGFLRVITNPKYPGCPGPPARVLPLLQALRQLPGHLFWKEELSIASGGAISFTERTSHKAITDLYLLALAVERRGKLATLDTRIDPTCVVGGSAALEMIDVAEI